MPRVNKIKQICEYCGKSFESFARQTACGRKCGYILRSKRHKKKGRFVKCKWCGKSIYKIPSKIRKRNFCCVNHKFKFNKADSNMSKGWTHTKEARDRIAEANRQKDYKANLTDKGREALRKSAIKNLQNKEAQKKSAQARINMKLSEEHKVKIRKNAKYGKDNHAYKGGITKLSVRIRDLPEYKKWRDVVFNRDDYTCQICGARSGNGKAVFLHPHHIISFSAIMEKYKIKSIKQAISCEALWDIGNGRTLCRECHEDTDNFAGRNLTTQN